MEDWLGMSETKGQLVLLFVMLPIWFMMFLFSFFYLIPKFFSWLPGGVIHVEGPLLATLPVVIALVLLRVMWSLALSFGLALIISVLVTYIMAKTIKRAGRWRR